MEPTDKKVTALIIQKRDKGRVNVYLNNEFAFGLDLMAAATLRKGQLLTPAEIGRLKSDDLQKQAYNRALRYLGYRPRSQAEIRRYLESKEYQADVVDSVINRLCDQGYVDDAAFADFWIENRLMHRPRGAYALRHELRQKGIDGALIEAALAELDEEVAAWDAVATKLGRWSTLDKHELRKKMNGFLSRRGFGYDAIRSTLERALQVREQGEDPPGEMDEVD